MNCCHFDALENTVQNQKKHFRIYTIKNVANVIKMMMKEKTKEKRGECRLVNHSILNDHKTCMNHNRFYDSDD